MSDRPTRCECGRVVGWVLNPDKTTPMAIPYHPGAVKGTRDDEVDLWARGACVTAEGYPAREGGVETVYRVHLASCQRRVKPSGGAPRFERARPPDRGRCARCGAPMLWIESPRLRKVPLDPEPITGMVLTKSEARELRGAPELVRGYTLAGSVVAIKRQGAGQVDLLEASREVATVYVSHFATCPYAAAFKRKARK